jgi:hypothetical protein
MIPHHCVFQDKSLPEERRISNGTDELLKKPAPTNDFQFRILDVQEEGCGGFSSPASSMFGL